MFTTPDVMRLAGELARHSAARQAVTAENIANADTPGYRAQETTPFSDHVSSNRMQVRTSREGHLGHSPAETIFKSHNVGGEQNMNGNDVNLEAEMVRSTQARSSHNMAIAVYGASLDVVRAALGRGR